MLSLPRWFGNKCIRVENLTVLLHILVLNIILACSQTQQLVRQVGMVTAVYREG